jgi:hypothetical protein
MEVFKMDIEDWVIGIIELMCIVFLAGFWVTFAILILKILYCVANILGGMI